MDAAVPDGCPLTPRQLEVVGWYCQGLTRREIARLLGIAENTVGVHLVAASRRAGTGGRRGLVRMARDRGWSLPGLEPGRDRDVARGDLSPDLQQYLAVFEASRFPHQPTYEQDCEMQLLLGRHR